MNMHRTSSKRRQALTHHEHPQKVKVDRLDFRVRRSALGISLGLLSGQMSAESQHGMLRVLSHELQQHGTH